MKYNSLISSIPQNWLKLLSEKNIMNLKKWAYEDIYLTININNKLIQNISTKEIYWKKVQSISPLPTALNQ